jgi:hypothetical protein
VTETTGPTPRFKELVKARVTACLKEGDMAVVASIPPMTYHQKRSYEIKVIG